MVGQRRDSPRTQSHHFYLHLFVQYRFIMIFISKKRMISLTYVHHILHGTPLDHGTHVLNGRVCVLLHLVQPIGQSRFVLVGMPRRGRSGIVARYRMALDASRLHGIAWLSIAAAGGGGGHTHIPCIRHAAVYNVADLLGRHKGCACGSRVTALMTVLQGSPPCKRRSVSRGHHCFRL